MDGVEHTSGCPALGKTAWRDIGKWRATVNESITAVRTSLIPLIPTARSNFIHLWLHLTLRNVCGAVEFAAPSSLLLQKLLNVYQSFPAPRVRFSFKVSKYRETAKFFICVRKRT